MPTKRLTPEERERIVDLRLQRVTIRAIANDVGCTTQTVQKVWNRYLKERAEERRADVEMQFEEALARLEKNATDARRGYLKAVRDDDDKAAAGYLAQERAALVEMAKMGPIRDTEPLQQARIAAAVEAELATAAHAVSEVVMKALSDMGMTPEVQAHTRRAIAERIREIGQ